MTGVPSLVGAFISLEGLDEQHRIYQLLHKKLMPMTLRWNAAVLKEICAPSAPTMQIRSCEDFLRLRDVVFKRLNKAGNDNAEEAFALARNIGRSKAQMVARRQGKSVPSPLNSAQLSLYRRVRNVNFMLMGQYVFKQWELAAMNVFFFNIVEREVLAEADNGGNSGNNGGAATSFDGFYISASGYAKDYLQSECLALPSVGQRVAYKVRRAQFGRLVLWAAALFEETAPFITAGRLEPRVVYSPIYAQLMSQETEIVPSVLEYFMRMMYASTVGDVAMMHDQERARAGLAEPTPVDANAVNRYFDVALAVTQYRIVLSKDSDKNEFFDRDAVAKSQDDDNDVHHPATQRRNASEIMSPALFLSAFDSIDEKTGTTFGDAVTVCESSRCLWVIWLENAERIFVTLYGNEYGAVQNKTATHDAASAFALARQVAERMVHIRALLVTLPPPHALAALFSALEVYIARQHKTLLLHYGFDIDYHGTIARLRRHLNDLIAAVYYCDTLVLQSHPIEEALRAARMSETATTSEPATEAATPTETAPTSESATPTETATATESKKTTESTKTSEK